MTQKHGAQAGHSDQPFGGHPAAGGVDPRHARIFAFGVNHRATPLALREKLAIPCDEIVPLLKKLRAQKDVDEVVAVLTCNRVEVYAALEPGEGALDRLVGAFCEARGVPTAEVAPFLMRYAGFDVARHLFEVTSGLDSMIPGENEVFAQVKGSYATASEAGTVGPFLDRLFQRSFRVAKEVRTATGISRRRVSLATVVVELTRKVFGDMKSVRLLLAGTGKMGGLALAALVDEGARVTVIANRTLDPARRLAGEHGCEAVSLEEIGEHLKGTDVYVGATGSPVSILHPATVEEAMKGRNGRTLLLVDLSVPRNIDPAVGAIPGVILCNMDDLQGIVDSNVNYRLEQAGEAADLVLKAVEEFSSAMRMDRISDTVTKLCEALEEVGEGEFQKTEPKLGPLTEAQKGEVRRMAQRIVAKILHLPLKAIRDEAEGGREKSIEAAVRKIFRI